MEEAQTLSETGTQLPLSETPKLEQGKFPGAHKKEQLSRIESKFNNRDRGGNDVDMLPTPTGRAFESPVRANTSRSPTSESMIQIQKRRTQVPQAKTEKELLDSNNVSNQYIFNQRENILDRELSKLGTYANLDAEQNLKGRILSEYIPNNSLQPGSAGQRSISLTGENDVLNLEKPNLKKEVIVETVETIELSPPASSTRPDENELADGTLIKGYLVNSKERKSYYWRKVVEIGSGNFSTVFLYENADDIPGAEASSPELKQVAVKRIKYPQELLSSSSPNSPKYKELLSRVESSLKRELTTLISLDHPCIVKLFGINDTAFITEDRPLCGRRKLSALPRCDMVMSFCAGGDLFDLASKSKIPDWLLTRILAELSMAIKYLHDNLVIHRDIKLENILLRYRLADMLSLHENPEQLNSQNLIELADFGLCKKISPDEMCTTRCGSEDYVSPEILLGLPYDGRLSDCWAFGVIGYALLEDRLPFDPIPGQSSRRTRSIAHRIARCDWKWLKVSEIEHPAKELVNHTLVRKSERWTINQIYDTPYIHDVVETLNFV